MSKRFTKGESLNLLKSSGLNTPIFRVFSAPFNREEIISAVTEFPDRISIRTWRKNTVECPFFPNKPKNEVAEILEELFDPGLGTMVVDEIILSQGIDPFDSVRCGRVSHLDPSIGETFAYLEYFNGPGTVRDLDKKLAVFVEREAIPRWGWQSPELWKLTLMSKCRNFFSKNPLSTLEWSMYPMKVGMRQDEFIFWEVL